MSSRLRAVTPVLSTLRRMPTSLASTIGMVPETPLAGVTSRSPQIGAPPVAQTMHSPVSGRSKPSSLVASSQDGRSHARYDAPSNTASSAWYWMLPLPSSLQSTSVSCEAMMWDAAPPVATYATNVTLGAPFATANFVPQPYQAPGGACCAAAVPGSSVSAAPNATSARAAVRLPICRAWVMTPPSSGDARRTRCPGYERVMAPVHLRYRESPTPGSRPGKCPGRAVAANQRRPSRQSSNPPSSATMAPPSSSIRPMPGPCPIGISPGSTPA